VPVTDPSGVDEAPVVTPPSGSAAIAAAALASPTFGTPALADGAERRGETPLQLDRMDARPDEPVDVVLALGANLGDAQGTLRRAVAELDTLTGVDVVEVGPLARTAAVGGPEQPDFLNTVVIVRTTLSPRELLHGCQSVEAGNGRERDVRWGPRTLDIDIVVFGDVIGSATDLELPHPRANERAFVLAPWAHLAPEAHLPGLGGGPVAALAATAHDREGIRWLALDWLHDAELPTAAQTSRPAAVAPALTAVQVVSLPDGETTEAPVTTQAPASSTEHSAAPVLGDQQPQAAQPGTETHHDVTHQETTAVETAQVWTPDVEPPRAETHLDSTERVESPDDTVDGAPAVEDRPL
jgi:dihydroneopterin aldolase/2-amino-4-hydroxy-6-hydroxymethyldihydropteridine diphosphokinase